jgi:hypothetical protein
METIKIEFKGYIEVDKEDITLMTADYITVSRSEINKLTTEQIVDGLKDGVYILEFMSSYINALNGEEDYEYSIPID